MRLLAVDFGSKRIGIAVGVDDPVICTAKPPLTPSGKLATDAQSISKLARDLEVDCVLLGIPINEEDDRMARICRKLGDEIRKLGVEVVEIDERLSSVEAEKVLLGDDLTAAKRKKLIDGEAARILLERYFESAKA